MFSKCQALLKDRVERVCIALSFQSVAETGHHHALGATVRTVVIINIMIIFIFIFILTILMSFPLKRGRCLNGLRQEGLKTCIPRKRKPISSEAHPRGGKPGNSLWIMTLRGGVQMVQDKGVLVLWQDLVE